MTSLKERKGSGNERKRKGTQRAAQRGCRGKRKRDTQPPRLPVEEVWEVVKVLIEPKVAKRLGNKNKKKEE